MSGEVLLIRKEVIMMLSLSDIEKDYLEYKELTLNRRALTDSNKENEMKFLYEKLFVISKTSGILFHHKDKQLREFSKQVKSNMIISYDLFNLNYFSASRKVLRSSIESLLRLALSLYRTDRYNYLIQNEEYEATKSLAELRSICDSSRIRRLTTKSKEIFLCTNLNEIIIKLDDMYSDFSSFVHADPNVDPSPKLYLNNVKEISEKDYQEIYLDIKNLVDITLVIFYTSPLTREVFTREDRLIMEKNLEGYLIEALDNI